MRPISPQAHNNNAFVMLAEWDVTDLEIAVLRGLKAVGDVIFPRDRVREFPKTDMAGIHWFNIADGIFFIAIGIVLIFSNRFRMFVVRRSIQATLWKDVIGEKWIGVVARYVFSAIAIAGGVCVIYAGIYGYAH